MNINCLYNILHPKAGVENDHLQATDTLDTYSTCY